MVFRCHNILIRISHSYSTSSRESQLFYQIMKDNLLISYAFMMSFMKKKWFMMQQTIKEMKIIH